MKNFFQKIFLLASITTLTACGTLFDKDNTPNPTPLKEFSASRVAKPLWQTSVGNGAGNESGKFIPAISNNKLFTASRDGSVSAVNQETGQVRWKINTGEPISSGVTANHAFIFVGTHHGDVIALQQSNGQQLWKTNIASEILAPVAANDQFVVVKSTDGNVTALSATTGRTVWHYQEKQPDLTLHGSSSPQIRTNAVFAGFESGVLSRLRLDNGTVLWRTTIAEPEGMFAVQRMVDIDADPLIDNNHVYVTTWQGRLAVLNAWSGNIIWSRDASSASGIAYDGKNIYLSDEEGVVSAYNANNGNVVWQQTQLTARNVSGPVLMGDTLLVGDGEGWLHWLNKRTGQFIARAQVSTGVQATPLVQNHIAYVYAKNGQLSAWTLH